MGPKAKSTFEKRADDSINSTSKLMSALAATELKSDMKTLRKNSCHEMMGMKRGRSQVPDQRHAEDLAAGTQIGPYLIEKSLNIDLKKKPLFIGVSGGTASGKTSVCEMSVFIIRFHFLELFPR